MNKDGEIQYLKNTFYQDNGSSHNEGSAPVTVTHFANCYDSRRWYIEGKSVLTDTASNTWFRAPGKDYAYIDTLTPNFKFSGPYPDTSSPIPILINFLIIERQGLVLLSSHFLTTLYIKSFHNFSINPTIFEP